VINIIIWIKNTYYTTENRLPDEEGKEAEVKNEPEKIGKAETSRR
jgi:hypothetical protein